MGFELRPVEGGLGFYVDDVRYDTVSVMYTNEIMEHQIGALPPMRRRGAHLEVNNTYLLSVQWGNFSYCTNHFPWEGGPGVFYENCQDAEMACWLINDPDIWINLNTLEPYAIGEHEVHNYMKAVDFPELYTRLGGTIKGQGVDIDLG